MAVVLKQPSYIQQQVLIAPLLLQAPALVGCSCDHLQQASAELGEPSESRAQASSPPPASSLPGHVVRRDGCHASLNGIKKDCHEDRPRMAFIAVLSFFFVVSPSILLV